MNKTQLVYKLKEIYQSVAPVRTKPLGAVGKKGTNFYSARPGWMRDTAFLLYSDTFVLSERLVGYIGYANVTSRKPGFIQKIDKEFRNEMIKKGGRIERI